MSAPARAPSPMTAEDLWRMPADGMKHELVRGELRTVPPPVYEHGRVANRVGRRLGEHADQHNAGDVTSEVGFRLPTDPETVRAPDVAFITRARIEEGGRPHTYFEGAPDLAVEVVLPSDTSTEVREKALDWLAAGTRLVLVVHPRPRTVTAYRSAADIVILRDGDTLEAGDVVAGWSVAVAELFG